MRFVVYGAGAVGGVVGARLALSGADVQLVARGEHLAAIRSDGLVLRTAQGDTRVDVPASDTVADLDLGPDTTVLVAVKGQQTQSVVDDLLRHAPDVTVVSLQNGVANERLLQRSFETVLGVCVMLPSTHVEPGVVIQASHPVPGMLDVGRYPRGTDALCEEYAVAVRAAGFACVVRPDVMAWKHRKLIMNLRNAVQACCGSSGEAADRLGALATDEGERVLGAAGIDVVTVEADRERRGDLLDTSAMRERGGGSTWQSLRRGVGSVESDHLNGEIGLQGRLHGVPTPVNDLLRRTTNRLAREGAAPESLDAADLLAELG